MKTALILLGGGSKGAMEVGACKVIFKKIIPDVIISSSVGSLNGVVLANGKDLEENITRLEYIWKKANRKTFFPYNPKLFYKFHFAKSIYSNKGLSKLLNKYISVNKFEDLDISLHVNCTNLINGETTFFSNGELFDPIVASCSAPPFFPPKIIRDVPYIDGGISGYFGVQEAINLKCKQIIIVNLRCLNNFVYENKNLSEYTNHIPIMIANQFMKHEIQTVKKLGARVIEMNIANRDIPLTDFSFTDELIRMGEEEASKLLDKIK